jgi:hypothetical protein
LEVSHLYYPVLVLKSCSLQQTGALELPKYFLCLSFRILKRQTFGKSMWYRDWVWFSNASNRA